MKKTLKMFLYGLTTTVAVIATFFGLNIGNDDEEKTLSSNFSVDESFFDKLQVNKAEASSWSWGDDDGDDGDDGDGDG